jgi:hypothetical protein
VAISLITIFAFAVAFKCALFLFSDFFSDRNARKWIRTALVLRVLNNENDTGKCPEPEAEPYRSDLQNGFVVQTTPFPSTNDQ